MDEVPIDNHEATAFWREQLEMWLDNLYPEGVESLTIPVPKKLKTKILERYDRGRQEHNYDDLRLLNYAEEKEAEVLDYICYTILEIITGPYVDTETSERAIIE